MVTSPIVSRVCAFTIRAHEQPVCLTGLVRAAPIVGMACSCSPDDRLRRVLMVRRLHPAVTMQSLLQTFGGFGSITGCKVFTHKSGRSAGCASVEFASHATACAAFRELQGSQLNGKSIHLQWFDTKLAQSPGRPSGHNLDLATSPGAEAAHSILAGRSSYGNGFSLPATPHDNNPGQLPHMISSPFGLLASSPQNPYCHSAAVAAAAAAAAAVHQHQLVQEQQRHQQAAVLLASSGHMQYAQQQHRCPPPMHPPQQQKLHRQVSAPIAAGFSNPGLQAPPSPHPSAGGVGLDALTSPGPCLHGNSDPGSMAAAVANLSAAMVAAKMPNASHDSNNIAALQQLAALQQQQLQQQLTALALQQISSSSQHSDSPLSPVRSVHGQQQSQQNAFAMAAALHRQQQAQLIQQFSGQLSAAPTQPQQQQQQKDKLQLAHSMPAALGTDVSSSCGSLGSQGQLHSSAFELAGGASILQRQRQQHLQDNQEHAFGSSGHAQQISPFALSQQVAESSTSAAPGGVEENIECSSDANATAAVLEPIQADTVPMSAKSLQGTTNVKAHHAKKQLFRDEHGIERGEHGLSLLANSRHRGYMSETGVGAAGMPAFCDSMQQSLAAMEAGGLSRANGADDTSVAGVDMLAAALAASSTALSLGCPSSYPLGPCWPGQDPALDLLASDLQASLQQQCISQTDVCRSSLLHSNNSAAAAMLQQQQMQLLASSMGSQPQLLPPLLSPHQQHNMQCSMPSAAVDGPDMASESVREWAVHPPHVRVRASDSQVLLDGNNHACSDATSAGFRLSSPSLPGSYGSPACHSAAGSTDAAAAAAAGAWQCAVLGGSNSSSSTVQQQQQAKGNPPNQMPASHVFKNKHKQQLQLELPGDDLVNAPLTSAQLGGAVESIDELITTEVLPDSPAAMLHCPLDVIPAVMAGTGAAGLQTKSRPCNGIGSISTDGSSAWADWSSSMAALLSPMHVPNMAGRRFTDCYMSSDHTALQMQREQQLLRQQHSRSVAGYMPATSTEGMHAGRSSTGLLGNATVSMALDDLHTAGTAQLQQGSDAGFNALGKTRHGRLSLDAHPQLLPFGLKASSEAMQSAALHPGCSSNNNGPNSQLKKGLLSDSGGLYSCRSFTFTPPVLTQQQLLQQPSFGGAGSNGDDSMITEPFQMPAFFRSGASCVPSSQQQQQAAGRDGSGCSVGSPTKAASTPLSSVAEGTNQQQQGSFESSGIELGTVAGSPALPCQLLHSFSLPARIAPALEPTGGPGRALKLQQHLPQQQQSDEAPYIDVFRSLWGSKEDESRTEHTA